MSFSRLLATVENRPYYASRLLLHAGIVAGVRALWRQMVTGEPTTADILALFYAWYLFLAVVLAFVLSVTLGRSWRRFAHIVTYGIVCGLLPPLIWGVFARGQATGGLVQMLFTPRQLLCFGWPDPGEFAAITGGLLLLGLFVVLRAADRQAMRTAVAVVGYVLTFAVAALLGMAADALTSGPLQGTFSDRQVMLALLLTVAAFALYVVAHASRFARSLSRIAHALPWMWTVLAASRYGGMQHATSWFLALTVLVLHVAIVMANDYYDRDMDVRSRATLDAEDVLVINAFTFAVAMIFLLRAPVIGALLMVYVVATLAYHHDSTRLKHVCPLNYKIEGIVGGIAFLVGMLAARPTLILQRGDLLAMFLAFVGFSLVSMFKDYKDVTEDRRRGVKTIYVVLERHGWDPDRTNVVVAAVVTLCLALPLLTGWLSWLHPWSRMAVGGMVVCAPFALLRSAGPTKAVRNTLWVINGYLALVALG